MGNKHSVTLSITSHKGSITRKKLYYIGKFDPSNITLYLQSKSDNIIYFEGKLIEYNPGLENCIVAYMRVSKHRPDGPIGNFVIIGWGWNKKKYVFNYGTLYTSSFQGYRMISSKYTGSFKNMRFNGEGILYEQYNRKLRMSDIKYGGNFENGEFNGHGILCVNEKLYYIGNFKNGIIISNTLSQCAHNYCK